MSPLLKNLITALGITALLGVAYMLISGNTQNEMVTDQTGSEISLKTEKILVDTQRLNDYLDDILILQDKRFTTLKDFRVTLESVSTGRANPFDPI